MHRVGGYLAILLFLVPAAAYADTDTVLLLHTNDLHDHVRVDYDGVGGLPYVSGYIRAQKAQRDDVLALDAGDVMEKGDRVAHETQSRLTYRAMERAGYDAAAPGNHDDTYGLAHLIECDRESPSMSLLSINLFDESGELLFPASKIFDVDGVRVGVIGMIRPRDEQSLTLEESAAAIAAEAEKLDEEAHLVVLTCHAGPADCEYISSVAGSVDVFVSGHTHAPMHKPRRTESGAYIVQAGSYAEFVGCVAITVDLETETLTEVTSELVPMDADHAPLDQELLDLILEEERRRAPNANDAVTHTRDGLDMLSIARLGAAALREYGDFDIGFCHAGQIIRATFPAGPVDENAVFRTGQRAHALVETDLSGADINAYLNGLARTGWGQTTWAGFRASRDDNAYKTSLEPDRVYRVVMPLKEWDTRFLRFFEQQSDVRTSRFQAQPLAFSYTEAVSGYLRDMNVADESLEAHCVELAAAMSLD